MQLLFFLLILFLPTQLGKHFWPDFSYILGMRIDYLSPTLYLSDVIAVFLIAKGLAQRAKGKANNSLLSAPCSPQVFTSLLFLFLSFGIFFSKSPMAGWYGLLKLLEFILLGFVLKNLLSQKKYVDLAVLAFCFGITLTSILAIWQFLAHSSIGGIFYYFGERTFNSGTPGIANASLNGQLILRPYGTFPHPNVLAGYLVIGMALLLYKITNSKSQITKILFITSLVLGTIALFISLSRVAIILWLLILGVYLFNFIKQKIHNTRYLILTTIFILAGIILLIILTPLRSRFFEITLSDESIVDRLSLLHASWQMFLSSPVLGVGFDNFFTNLPELFTGSSYVQLVQPVHNIFALVLAETGGIGLIFCLWFLFRTFKKVGNCHSEASAEESSTRMTKLTLLACVLVLGMFDHYFLTLQQGQLLLTFVLAYCWSA